MQLEIPPVKANSNVSVDARKWLRPRAPARRVVWSGLYGEEFAPDKYVSAELAEQLATTRVAPLEGMIWERSR